MSNAIIKREYLAKTEELSEVILFVEEQLEKCGASMKTIHQVELAIEEVFVNVCHYAYPESPGRASLSIETDEANRYIIFTLSDSGFPFNPLEMDDPDISLDADERSIGGLGVFLVKKMMDETSYVFEDNHNVLRLSKKY